MVGAGLEREADGDGTLGARRGGETLAGRLELLLDLVEDRHLADVVEADRRVVQPERPERHQAREELGHLVVQIGGDVEVRERAGEEVVHVAGLVEQRVDPDALGPVEEREHERAAAAVGPLHPPDREGGEIAEEAALEHVERERPARALLARGRHRSPALEDALDVPVQIAKRRAEAKGVQHGDERARLDAALEREALVGRGERPGAVAHGSRKGVGDRPPEAVEDVPPDRLREGERDVGLVAGDDQRAVALVERFPEPLLAGEPRERLADPPPVDQHVLAVEVQPLVAERDRGLRVHPLEGALGAVGAVAELGVEVVEDREDQARAEIERIPSRVRRGELPVEVHDGRTALDHWLFSGAGWRGGRREESV